MSRPESRKEFERLIRTGEEGTIKANGTTYRLVRSRFRGPASELRRAPEKDRASDE